MWIFFPFGPRAGAATQSVGERSRRPRTGRAQHPQMWRLAGARGVRACVHVRVHAGAGQLNREHLVEPGAQLPEKLSAGHGVSKASRHVRGLGHSKIIKRKSCELKFMVEPACLGGAGFAGTADASRAAGAGGNWTPGSLGGGRGAGDSPTTQQRGGRCWPAAPSSGCTPDAAGGAFENADARAAPRTQPIRISQGAAQSLACLGGSAGDFNVMPGPRTSRDSRAGGEGRG